jgi:hypothetical protein
MTNAGFGEDLMTNSGCFEEAAMSGLTGGNRGRWPAAALAVAAAVAALTTGRGLVHVHAGSSGGSATTGSAAPNGGPAARAHDACVVRALAVEAGS